MFRVSHPFCNICTKLLWNFMEHVVSKSFWEQNKNEIVDVLLPLILISYRK